MGICFSARIKAETPPRTGVDNFPYVSSDGNDSSSKISPVPPRTEGEILESSNMKSFAFSDLKMATRNFRPDSLLGGGGFGSVFKGWIDENTFAATKLGTGVTIAVKKLHQESFQGHREWLAEVNYLGQFSHPNLVKLILQCRYKKWRIKDLLLFRSASESRAKDNDEELVGKYESTKRAVRREDDGDVRGSSSRRRSRPSISTHEVHYTINRQLSKEMKKKTFLPYKRGLLGCLRFHQTVPDASAK